MDILLVYMLTHLMDPRMSTAPEVSKTVYESREQCMEFVNTLAGSDVFNENYKYKFMSNDGFIIYGGCLTPQELDDFKEQIREENRQSLLPK